MRPQWPARGGQLPSHFTVAGIALDRFDPCMFKDLGARFHGSPRQPGHITRRIASGADLVDHPTVIDRRSDLGTQPAPGYDAQLVIEFDLDHFCLALVIVKMLLLAGHLKMAAAREIAVDSLFAHDLL